MALTFWRLARLVLFLGAVALILAVIGIYGVVAFAVSRRKREIGIRMALGATRGVVVRTILRPGMRPVLAGLAVGSVLTIGGVYGLAQVLRETPLAVSTLDPFVYLAVSVILIGSAAAAMLGPAWHATRADPVAACCDIRNYCASHGEAQSLNRTIRSESLWRRLPAEPAIAD